MKPNHAKMRKKPGNSSGWLIILLVIILIIGLFVFLNYLEKKDDKNKSEYKTEIHEKMEQPAVPLQQRISSPVYEYYSSAASPVVQDQRKTAVKHLLHGGGTVSIIIDDMGSSITEFQQLHSIGVPLTFSVIPGLPHAREVAEAAIAENYQVMLHIPMEPEGYPAKRVEKNALLMSMNDEEIRDRMNGYFKILPVVSGANNHMGSRFTTSASKMKIVMEGLKSRKLFFVDSMTTPNSVGYDSAMKAAVPAAKRAVFIDNKQDAAYMKGQLEQLISMAKRNGSAVGICHPHPATIKALSLYLPELAASGTKFVFAGDIVEN